MKKSCVFMALAIVCFVSVQASAAMLGFSFSDPTGDHTGIVDLIDVSFVFDNVTGDYTINFKADASNPFTANFQLNAQFYNADTGTTNQNPSFFSDIFNDFDLDTSTLQTIILTGNNTRLQSWDAGDRIVADVDAGLGAPLGALKLTNSVYDLPNILDNDIFGDGVIVTTGAVPIPGAVWLLGSGLLGMVSIRRKLKK